MIGIHKATLPGLISLMTAMHWCQYSGKTSSNTNTDRRIVDIALECGFPDAKYLVKHFKNNFGYTPSRFRKMYRTDDKTLASQVKYRDYPLSHTIKQSGILDIRGMSPESESRNTSSDVQGALRAVAKFFLINSCLIIYLL